MQREWLRSDPRRSLGGALCLIAFVAALGCRTPTRVGKPPPCPAYSEAAIIEMAHLIESGDYPALEYQLGRQEIHCEAIASLRR